MKQNRTIVFFSIIMLFALLASTLIATFSISKISQEYSSERLSTLSTDIERSINDVLSQTINVSRTIANDTFLTSLMDEETDPEEMKEQMAVYTRRLEKTFSYQWVFIASDKTKAYYSDGTYQILDPDSEDDSWYADFVNGGQEYDATIGTDNDAPDAATFFVDVRIENEQGEFLGVCGIAMNMDKLVETILEFEEEYGVKVQFVDEDKEVQLGNKEENVQIDELDLDEIGQEKILVNRQGLDSSYSIIRFIDQLGWYMVIRDYDPLDKTVDLFLIVFTTISSILVILITVLGLWYILRRNRMLFASSYKDEMTGLYNRRAYEDKCKELRKCDSMQKYTVFVFDVNGLKIANDTHGHFAGDELIRGASQVIREVFGPHGQCFRTGGDEFMAILDDGYTDIQLLVQLFEEKLSEWKGEYVDKLSISYGAVLGSQNPDWTVDELTALADEKMYWQKRDYYKNASADRRRA